MTTSKIQMDQIRSTSATVTGENIRAGSQKKSSLSQAEGLQGASPDATCTCPSGDGSLVHPCPAHPASVEQAGGDERTAFEAWMTWLMDHVYGRLPDFTLDDGSGAHYVNADVSYAWTAWQARAALAQPSPVRSSLLINGYQLRDALEFIAPDGTAEQLESEARIEWRQQDADFLEAGLYAWCAEYPEEGCVLLDEEPTTSQPSPAPTLRAAIDVANDRFEVPVAKWGTDLIGEEGRPKVVARLYRSNAKYFPPFAEVQKPLPPGDGTLTVDPLITLAQYDRDVGTLRFERQQMDRAFTACINERDAALARVAELEAKLVTALGLLRESYGFVDCDNPLNESGQIKLLEEIDAFLNSPVAQAQHSVPELEQSRSALTEAQMRRIYENSTEAENERLGFAAFARLMRRAEAVHQIAAAPGKEVGHE
ncbi:hypothetical protein ACM7D9_29945 [Pseudomonas aeruginosa]